MLFFFHRLLCKTSKTPAEELKSEKFFPPYCLALRRRRLDEALALRGERDSTLWSIHKIQHFGRLYHRDDPAKLSIGIGSDAKHIFFAAARIQILQQSGNFVGRGSGKK